MLDFNNAGPQDDPRKRRHGGGGSRHRIDATEIKERLNEDVRGFVLWLYSGRAFLYRCEARIGNALGEVGSSLSIELEGKKVGQWYDHATDEGGDLIKLYRLFAGYVGDSDNFERSLKEIAHDFLGWPVELSQPSWNAARIPTPNERIAANKEKWGAKPKSEEEVLGAAIAEYFYRDIDGNIVCSVRRYEPKTFRPFILREIDGVTNWMVGSPSPRPLYHLPEIAKADAVVLTEGEGKADKLAARGIVSTSVMGGANATTKTDWTPLTGKTVIIWPDNDDDGKRFATEATAKLLSIGCTVLVVPIPVGKPAKWDAANCIDEGGDPEVLIAAAVEVDAGSSTTSEHDTSTGNGAGSSGAHDQSTSNEQAAQSKADDLLGWDAGDDNEMPPPRAWLLGNSFCRGFGSSLLGDGGVGKTALRCAQMLSLATGRPLTGEHVFQRCRVLILSLEDGANELRRRLWAACLHHKIDRSELKGWLFVDALGRKDGKLMSLDEHNRPVLGTLPAKLERTVVARKIDIVMLDPFIKSHRIAENDNNGIDEVAQILTDMAETFNIAVDIPHHISKGPADPGNANRGRGASSLKDALRLVRTATAMAAAEAQRFGLSEIERRKLIRIDDAKLNVAPAGEAKWFKLIGVDIGNASKLYPNGDNVQTVEPWKPPDPLAGMTGADFDKVASVIRRGKWRESSQATAWAGYAVAEALDLDASKGGPDRSRVTEMLKVWLKAGSLIVVERQDEHRELKKFVEVKDDDD